MSSRTRLGIGVAVVLIAAVAGWFVFLRGDTPDEVSIDDAALSAAETTVTTDTAAATATTAAPTTTVAPAADASNETTTTSAPAEGITGTWTVREGSDSFVGYRVEEELARVGFTTAVGRTSDVEVTMVVDGTVISAIDVLADLTTLRSDADFRDRAIRTQALETNDFPTATFMLTEPVDLGSVPADGETVAVTIAGDLTIHGVTQAVMVDIESQLVDDAVVVVGSVPIAFADYDIDQPSAAAVLSVDDNGIMEFQLILERS